MRKATSKDTTQQTTVTTATTVTQEPTDTAVQTVTQVVQPTVDPATVTPPQVTKVLTIAGVFWDWFDKRDVEKHAVAAFTLWLTYLELTWGMRFAEAHASLAGSEISLILAAIGVPLTALQAAVIGFYFRARSA